MDKAFYTDKGGRKVNEDSIAFESRGSSFCAILADGLGGQGNGDVASQTTVKTLSGQFLSAGSAAPEDITRYFNAANDAVLAINHGKNHTLSTAVALFYDGRRIVWAHVGDSRLYHFAGGKLADHTLDHSVPQMAVMLGDIGESGIRFHPDRNRILRAVGSTEEIKTSVQALEDPAKGQHAFLLCSDGFWEYVFEAEMDYELSKARTAQQWLDGMKRIRDSRAPQDADNNSAITVFLELP